MSGRQKCQTSATSIQWRPPCGAAAPCTARRIAPAAAAPAAARPTAAAPAAARLTAAAPAAAGRQPPAADGGDRGGRPPQPALLAPQAPEALAHPSLLAPQASAADAS